MPNRPARFQRLIRKTRRALFRNEPGYYDMFENPGERYFGRLYLHHIREVLRAQGRTTGLNLLDAGCQAGRLTIPLALDGHHVTGVDTSDLALRRARRHAREAGARSEFIRADLSRWLPRCREGNFDAVLCAEVLYLRSNHRALLQELIRVLRPGGLCFISHRPVGYYLAESFQRRDWEAVKILLSGKREGALSGSYYNWQDRQELEDLYQTLGVEILAVRPIGFLSWLGIKPDDFSVEEQELLFRADVAERAQSDCSGRYLLVIGRKR